MESVETPKHYTQYPVEVIDIIRKTLTPDQFIGYCFGNVIKYRMRAGHKNDAAEDLAKAAKYEAWMREAQYPLIEVDPQRRWANVDFSKPFVGPKP